MRISDWSQTCALPICQETAILHLAEHWRERLIDEGDKALAQWLQEFPDSDRQQLRQLLRNARDERSKARPPRALRGLLRSLRASLGTLIAISDRQSGGQGKRLSVRVGLGGSQ